MIWVTHYWNPKIRQLACKQNMGMAAGRGMGSARDVTQGKSAVTCKRCLNQIARWAEIEKRRTHGMDARKQALQIIKDLLDDHRFTSGGIPDETQIKDLGFTDAQIGTIESSLFKVYKTILAKIQRPGRRGGNQ